VPPIDNEALAGRGLHAHVSTSRFAVLTCGAQVVYDHGDAAVIAQRLQTLRNQWCICSRILLQQLSDDGFERIKFAGPIAPLRGGADVARYLAIAGRSMRGWSEIWRCDHFSTKCRRWISLICSGLSMAAKP
jgi:hypothetical protein